MKDADLHLDSSRIDELQRSPRRRAVAMQLAFFLGFLGAYRWYMGKPKSAAAKMLTCSGLGLWWLYDLFQLGFRDVFDGDGKPLEPPLFSNPAHQEREQIADKVLAEDSMGDKYLEEQFEQLHLEADEEVDG